jgi:hypothetical protein
MISRYRFAFVMWMIVLTSFSSAATNRASDAVWVDFDMRSIPEPQERPAGLYENLIEGQFFEQWKRAIDVPRWVRSSTGGGKPADNVNAWDEVPDSSWYTNRHHRHPMSVDELVRGPNQITAPDLTDAVITKAKIEGVTPGLQLKDRKGDAYIIKFDNANYPELQSAAEVISTKILYAAGYNVPENYLAYLDPNHLTIGDKVEITELGNQKRAFTRQDLDEMLRRVARMRDGRYRVLASKFIPGKPKGPPPHIGLRRDDPNDLIPHEHRRELRGLRVIASWINHWDLKEENSLDTYVEENGRKFLRHYLIDFGSTLGAGRDPHEYFRGREYAFDAGTMVKEIFSLGFYVAPSEKQGQIVSPEVGTFTAEDFDPAQWRPAYPVMAFLNMTDEDAFWATRIILSFTEPELRKIIETAHYSNPKNAEYVLKTLLVRRQIIARHWLPKVNPIADLSIIPTSEGGATLRFRDLLAECKCMDVSSAKYVYQIEGHRYTSEKKTTAGTEIPLQRAVLGAAMEGEPTGAPVEMTIWVERGGVQTAPTKIHFNWSPAGDNVAVQRIRRG